MSSNPEIIITVNPTQLAQIGAEIFKTHIQETTTTKATFSVALSGGSTPRLMHQLLKKEPYLTEIPWEAVHIFWTDERCVPIENPASNYGTARKDFLDAVPIPKAHIHPMPADILPTKAAKMYQDELKAFFQPKDDYNPIFDLVFLGVGTDGHTASLFSGRPTLDEEKKWVLAVKGGNPDVFRLTLNMPVLNTAKHIVFLASGKEKAQIIKEIFNKRQSPLPVQRIQPVIGKLTWLMDKGAASLLSKGKSHGKSKF